MASGFASKNEVNIKRVSPKKLKKRMALYKAMQLYM